MADSLTEDLDLPRFRCVSYCRCESRKGHFVKEPDGTWVRFEDVEKLLDGALVHVARGSGVDRDDGLHEANCISQTTKQNLKDAGSRPDELGEHARAPERLPKAGAHPSSKKRFSNDVLFEMLMTMARGYSTEAGRDALIQAADIVRSAHETSDVQHLMAALVQQEGVLTECEAILREALDEHGVNIGFDERLQAYWAKSNGLSDWRSRDLRLAEESRETEGHIVDAVGLDELLAHLDSGFCECRKCVQCDRMPADCSGTDCAKTCDCTECDHCRIQLARAGLKSQEGPRETSDPKPCRMCNRHHEPPECSLAWLVEDGVSPPRYRTADSNGFGWTLDVEKAIRLVRRCDAEMLAAADDAAWNIVEHLWCSSPEEPSGDESNIQTLERTAHPAAQVAGDRLETTVAQFVTRAQHLLIEEQEKPNPDNALVGFLCDAVRLAREHSREATAPIGCTCGWMRIPDSPDPMDCRRYRFKAGCSGAVATGVHPIYPDVCPACARPVRLLNPSPNDVVRWICPVCSTVNDNRDERCCVGTCKGVRPNPWPFCDDARDAARYRYLRERLACDRLAARKLVITTEGGREPYRTLREAELDREIDECIGSSVEPKTQQVYPPPGKQNCTCKKTCERHGMPFPPGWPWQCQGFPYEPREIDRLPEKASACNCRSLPEPPSANCPIHGDDICAECGAELVSDTCDKCGAENGGEKHGD